MGMKVVFSVSALIKPLPVQCLHYLKQTITIIQPQLSVNTCCQTLERIMELEDIYENVDNDDIKDTTGPQTQNHSQDEGKGAVRRKFHLKKKCCC